MGSIQITLYDCQSINNIFAIVLSFTYLRLYYLQPCSPWDPVHPWKVTMRHSEESHCSNRCYILQSSKITQWRVVVQDEVHYTYRSNELSGILHRLRHWNRLKCNTATYICTKRNKCNKMLMYPPVLQQYLLVSCGQIMCKSGAMPLPPLSLDDSIKMPSLPKALYCYATA